MKKKNNGYKQTEIGVIPSDWDLSFISTVFELSKKPKSLTIKPDDLISFIPMDSISNDGSKVNYYLHKKRKDISSGTYIAKNDVIIAKITPSFENGKQAILFDLPYNYGFATTEVWALHPITNKAIPQQLYYYLKIPHIRNELSNKMEGSTGRQRLPINVLLNLKIPLPPLPEQKAIAHILSTIQEAKEKTEAVIQATKELKKSMMKHLFTYGAVPVDEVDKVKLKETEIGLMPEDWKVVKLNDNIEKTKQLNPKNIKRIKYIDVSSISNETFNIVEFKEYDGKKAPSRARKVIKTNDIIFATVRPSLKRIAIVKKEFDEEFCSTAFCVIRPKIECFTFKYLFYYVTTSIFVNKVTEFQRGASYPSVTDTVIKNQFIPLPSKKEQEIIGETLFNIDRKIISEQNKKQALDTLFKTLLNNLMTGKIRTKE